MAITNGKVKIAKNDGILDDLGYVRMYGDFIAIPTRTSDPASGSLTTLPAGTMYFNTSTGFLRIYDGSAWSNH